MAFDLNFHFPVTQLENYKVCLSPFNPALHADAFYAAVAPNPDLFTYIPIHPFSSSAHLTDYVENRMRKDPSSVLFVIFDKTRHGPDNPVVAGAIALINTNPHNLVTEIAWVLILPEFQRTHVTTNAVGLLLHYCLDAPTKSISDDLIGGNTPGLGLRRVQWQANEENAPSIRAATRLGFRYEGILRWDRCLPPGKSGPVSRAADPKSDCPGRHTAILSLCWDDWEDGARDKVRALMAR